MTTPQTTPERVRVEIDRDAMLAGLVRHRRRFADAAAQLDEDALAQPTRCTDWTVADVFRHYMDTDDWLRTAWAGGKPAFADPAFDPARSPHESVVAKRGISDTEVRDVFVTASNDLATAVESDTDDWNAPVLSPIGTVARWVMTLHLFFDSFCHERDVLIPLGRKPPELADETVPVFAYVLALAGLTIREPAEITLRGVRLVTGNGPPVTTPVQPRADVGEAIDALSGRADIDEVFADVDPDVVRKLSVLPRLIAGPGAVAKGGSTVSGAERSQLLSRRLG